MVAAVSNHTHTPRTPLSPLMSCSPSLPHTSYPLPPSPGLGFELLQDGYRNISNIDISASVISQMNRMQRMNGEWQRDVRGDRRERDRDRDRDREGGDDSANELDCK